MAIFGLTHGTDGKLESKVIKYRGKISTGYGPKEGPNTKNFPVAAGHFIAMKEVTKNQRVGNESIPVTKWIENKEIQKLIEQGGGSGKTPRLLELVCLFQSPEDMWESFLAKYSQSEGLMCRGHGIGTEAKYLTFDSDGNRQWKTKPCTYTECPDHIAGTCKPNGHMKIYPAADPTPPNPYKFETRSLNTIRNLESALEDIWNLIKLAHATKEQEAGHSLPFDGMFGMKLYLMHKKTKSGGRDVFVTELLASKEFRENIMKVIGRAIGRKQEVQALEGEMGSMSLLDNAASVMIEDSSEGATVEAIEVESEPIDAEAKEAIDAAMTLLEGDEE